MKSVLLLLTTIYARFIFVTSAEIISRFAVRSYSCHLMAESIATLNKPLNTLFCDSSSSTHSEIINSQITKNMFLVIAIIGILFRFIHKTNSKLLLYFLVINLYGHFGTHAISPEWLTFLTASTVPPQLQTFEVCGIYYAQNNSVYFFGGYNQAHRVTRYDIFENTFYTLQDSPISIYCYGQSIVIIDDIVYLPKFLTNTLVTYNISSGEYNSTFTSIPSMMRAHHACFANLNHLNDAYLFVIGDCSASGECAPGSPKSFRIFDLMQHVWYLGPDTPINLDGAACTVQNNYLYVLGGLGLQNVMKINIGDIQNIANYSWITLSGHSLSNGIGYGGSRIVVHEDENILYFVGQEVGIIDAMDIRTETIYNNVSRTIEDTWGAPAIIANNDMLIFGGAKSFCCSSFSSIWQFAKLQTSAPTTAPSMAPSVAPTESPLSACIDYKQKSNDGNNETIMDVDSILNEHNYHKDDMNALQFQTSDINDYSESIISCMTLDCFIKCNYTSSCFQTKVQISNTTNKSIVMFCDKQHSCGSSSISVQQSTVSMLKINIICADKYSCIDMKIDISNIVSFNMYCITYGSCLDVNISIESSNGNTDNANDGIIQCIGLNGCDNLKIKTNSNETQLIMVQHSKDVILDNGIGFLYDNINKNVLCNIDRYIKVESDHFITTDYLSNLVKDEYKNELLPCSDVNVLCGPFSCSMTYLFHTINDLVPDSGCYWVNVQEIQNIICEGQCISSPTSTPTSKPTQIPTTPTIQPSDSPTNAPSNTPSSTPTANPTDSPTSTPSAAPTSSPTVSPTSNPSASPTNFPSSNPTLLPSAAPTASPTFAPSLSPTVSPTTAPSRNPTNAPTLAPSVSPSSNPSTSPTISPSNSPSRAPTRFPTKNIEDIYHSFMDVIYVIEGLKLLYVEMLEDNTLDVIPHITQSIEYGYFVKDAVEYKDFTIQIKDINGFEDLTNINLKEGYDINLNAEILSSSAVSELLLRTSKTDEFANETTIYLKQYFTDNDNLKFYVKNKESLNIYTDESIEEESSFGIIIFSVLIVGIGALSSIYVKWSNKRENALIDNAKWLAPLLFSLQIYDFVSDINLSYDILTNPLGYGFDARSTMIFWCGIFSVLFIILPFVTNLLYGIRIKKQDVIIKNRRADEYFTANMAFFLSLVICSAGCFPALLMVSSRIFGLNILQSGLSKHDLNELTKIKIKSSITMENGPQLLIQIIYALQTKGSISTAVFLAFVGSFLSVIMALSSYYANKQNRKNEEMMTYYLKFTKKRGNNLSDDEENNMNKNKGRREELEKSIAKEFGISHDNVEIGYIWTLQNGLEMYICHYLSKSELAKYNKENHGYWSMITPKQYLLNLYHQKSDSINNIFRKHFDVKNLDLMVQIIIDYKDKNMDNTDNDRTQLISLQHEHKENNGNDQEIIISHDDGYESIPTIKSMQIEMHQIKHLMDNHGKMMQSIIKHINGDGNNHNDLIENNHDERE